MPAGIPVNFGQPLNGYTGKSGVFGEAPQPREADLPVPVKLSLPPGRQIRFPR